MACARLAKILVLSKFPMMDTPERDFDSSMIVGSIPGDIKQAIVDDICRLTQYLPPEAKVFGESIQKRLRVTELSVKKDADEPIKPEVARVVVEIDVTEGILLH